MRRLRSVLRDTRASATFAGTQIVLAVLAWSGAPISAAQAQDVSPKAMFEKYHLLGTFARDCGSPPSSGNVYYVHRATGTGQVQRDGMYGSNERLWLITFDKVAELKPNELAMSGQFTGKFFGKQLEQQHTDAIWQVQGNRARVFDSTLAGEKVVEHGRAVRGGQDVPWVTRCGD
jgi:hypothetical protein